MLTSPEAAPPLALHHPHLPLYALLSIGACFAVGVAAYVEVVSPGVWSRSSHEPGPRVRTTYENMHELADLAFPAWRVAHPHQACPASLDEVAAYTSTPTTSPYSQLPYGFRCAGHGIWVIDPGDDGVPFTADDLTSDRP